MSEMILSVEIENRVYEIDWQNPIDISIPLIFNGAQPNAFDVEPATAIAYETGNLIGDTRRGGGCNFEQIKFIPHCSGTHTECVGHITRERITIQNILQDCLIPATLITVEPENFADSNETYPVDLTAADALITKKSIETAFEKTDRNWLGGLIVRTSPNDENKKTRNYMKNLPSFFSTEAINFISDNKVNHLLIDTPSIDRTFDEGKLSNHRVFWNVEPGKFDLNSKTFINRTITEMIFAPDSVVDGKYLLNLQIAAFAADAAPSRPILLKIIK